MQIAADLAAGLIAPYIWAVFFAGWALREYKTAMVCVGAAWGVVVAAWVSTNSGNHSLFLWAGYLIWSMAFCFAGAAFGLSRLKKREAAIPQGGGPGGIERRKGGDRRRVQGRRTSDRSLDGNTGALSDVCPEERRNREEKRSGKERRKTAAPVEAPKG